MPHLVTKVYSMQQFKYTQNKTTFYQHKIGSGSPIILGLFSGLLNVYVSATNKNVYVSRRQVWYPLLKRFFYSETL
jgi:hypothetical protein